MPASLDIRISVAGPAAPPPPLSLRLDFAAGNPLSFEQSAAEDVGDYIGPIVHQKCLRQIVGPWLIDFRPDADGRRNEIVVEFGSLVDFSASPPKTASGIAPAHSGPYTATISGGGLAAPVVINVPAHWWGARWRWQSAPRPIVRKLADLVAMRAILPLDAGLDYGAPIIQAPRPWKGPMDTGGLTVGMPSTGDRPDIGMMTEWQAQTLLGNAAAEITMLAGAEATGTMVFWVRDAATGTFIDCGAHPYIAFADASAPKYTLPAAKAPAGAANYFMLDAAHMPEAAFVPWLMTDDPYFLEAAQATAQYNILENNYRRINDQLPMLASTGQTRAFAWGLRDLFQQAGFAPEMAPSWLLPRSYWQKVLTNSLTYVRKYISATVSPCTTVFKLLTQTQAFEPFMLDYLGIVLGWAKWTGKFPGCEDVVEYASTMRLALSDYTGASGWDHRFPVPYMVPVFDGRKGAAAVSGNNDQAVVKNYTVPASPDTPTSWAELWACFQKYAASGRQPNWTDPATWPPDELVKLQTSYLPEARAALAAFALAGLPNAAAEHDWLKRKMDSGFPHGIVGSGRKWAVSPA